MNFCHFVILQVLFLVNFVWVANAGGQGTILIKTSGKRRKGDIIIIEGGGKDSEKAEVSYKYEYIPVPMYMPKRNMPKKIMPVYFKMPQQMPMKSMPIEAQAIEAQVIEAMVAKGGAPMISQPIQAQFVEAMAVQANKGGIPNVMHGIPMKGMAGGGAEWWRRK